MKNSTKPKISVIMSVYSEPIEWLKEAIDSILTQTFSDFEFIIINDKPNRKENCEVLAEYQKNDKRVVIVTNKENIGLTKSLNKGLKLAKGKYIARMDADDISLPTRFEKQYKFMESNPKVIVCGTNIKYIGNKGLFTFSDWIRFKDDDIKASLIFNSCFAHPSVIIRHSILNEKDICYDENYKQTQDYRLWEILRTYGKYANLKEPLLQYRVSDRQVSVVNGHNQVNYGADVRNRIISESLDNFGIECKGNIDAKNILEKRKLIIEKSKNDKAKRIIAVTLLKRVYFSKGISWSQRFFNFYFKFDFLRFSLKTNLRFIAVLFNLKKVIEL